MTVTLTMPASFVDVSKDEMVYEDGGFIPLIFIAIGCAAASFACSTANEYLVPYLYQTGALTADEANLLSAGLVAGSVAFGLAGGCASLGGKLAAKIATRLGTQFVVNVQGANVVFKVSQGLPNYNRF